jgi:hypothetical protein
VTRGGQPRQPGQPRRRRRCHRRPALAAGLTGWILLAAALPAAAAARPRPAGQPATTAATTAATASRSAAQLPPEEPLPVRVTIEQLVPREVRPGATVEVLATLRNTGQTPTGPLRYRLQRGALITTRSELAAADATPPTVTTRFAPTAELPAGLAPGQARRVHYRCAAEDLSLLGVGVYPVGFVVQAVPADDAPTTVGRAQTLLPSFTGVDPAPTRVAWLWPLLDRPHRLPSDVAGQTLLDNDELARSVAAHGRLDQLLAAAEAVTGRVNLTLVVDPETVETLQLMTKDYRYRRAGRSVAGHGQLAAANWLQRLRRVAPRHLVAVVPYGDPDIDALERAAKSRPVQSAGDADLRIVDGALRVQATSGLVWPPGGVLTDHALDDVVSHANAVVLDAAALPGGVSRSTPTPSAASPLPALGGRTTALVADGGLQSVVARAALYPGGPRLAEQRYLAELGMITAEQPANPRTVVIAPPRRWSPALPYAAAVLADTGRISWLTSRTAAEAVGTPPVDRGPLVYPPAAAKAELPTSAILDIYEVAGMVDSFRSVLTNKDASVLLAAYPDALRRATSSAWRGNLAGQAAFVKEIHDSITSLRGKVRLQKPLSGVYTLASANSPLTLLVVNSLNTQVRIGLKIKAPAGFRVADIGPQDIPANSRRTLQVPTNVQRTGTFEVDVQLVSPTASKSDLGAKVTLTVRSTAYGSLALSITGAALLVLIGAMVFRLLRRLRSADGGPLEPAGSPGERSIR